MDERLRRIERYEALRASLAEARAGMVEVRVSKVLRGSRLPCVVDPRRTAEKALVAEIQEA